MRKRMLWGLALLALIATPAIVGVAYLGGGSAERRLGAAGVESAAQIAAVKLNLDGVDYGFWRKLNWGIDQEVSGGTAAEKLSTAGVKNRPMVLERGLLASAETQQFISAIKKGQRYAKATVVIMASDGKTIGSYTLNGVLIGFVEHEINTAAPPPLERLALRYEDVSFAP